MATTKTELSTHTFKPANEQAVQDAVTEAFNNSTNQTLAWDYTTTADTVYIGKAAIGTATSAASWKIYKYDLSTGRKTYADSDNSYDNIWDNRASLTYG